MSTSPQLWMLGAREESANSHALWCACIAELSEEIAQLRGQLRELGQ